LLNPPSPHPLPPPHPTQTVLALAPNDADALAAKAVAHLELGEFDAASACLSSADSPLASDPAWKLEQAYCLYRRGLLREALALLPAQDNDNDNGNDRLSAATQLRAQLHYRLGMARECVRDYEALLGSGAPLARDPDTQDQLLEIKTNAVAAHVAAGLGAQVPQLMAALKLPTGRVAQSYESEYNRACALLSAGGGGGGGGAAAAAEQPDFAAAEAALRHALRAGEEALYAEDLAEEEVLDELSPLHAQLAYVAARTGRLAEAAERLEPLVSGELSDAATAAVAAVNHAACALTAAAAGDAAAAKSVAAKALRRLEHAISERGGGGGGGTAAALATSGGVLALRADLASRLSPEQQRAVHLSRALLMGLAGRVEQAREVASALAKQSAQQPQQKDSRVSLLLAALLARAGKTAEAEAALAALGDDPMDEDGAAVDPSAPLLLRAQLAAEAGDAARAATLLSELPGGPSAALAPGVLATRVALLERAGRADEAEALLEQGLGHWQQRVSAGGGKASAAAAADSAAAGVGWCLQRLVSIKLAAGKTPEAMRLYQQLVAGGAGGSRGKGGSAAAAAVAAGAAGAAVVARLARAAAAASDADSVSALERQLPGGSADAAGAGLDTDALEDVTRVLGARRGGAKTGGGKDDAAAEGEAAGEGEAAATPAAADAPLRKGGRSTRRKRKPRYPQGYDESKGPGGGLPAPDPERWLPKWQRSTFKKQQRRRNRDARDRVVGSQGAGKVDEALDRTGKAMEAAGPLSSSAPAAPAPARPSLPPRQKGRPRK
jgi:signal recognition particle subunit SRP72